VEITSVKSRFGKDIYRLDNGTSIKMKKGSGTVDVNEKGVVKISGGENVSVSGSNKDDKILIENSSIKKVSLGGGENKLWFNGCKFNDFNMFLGSGTEITTANEWGDRKKGSSEIYVNGDFTGYINAQQGSVTGHGDDKDYHKDTIIVNGDNKGDIQIDSHDKVRIKGDKGHLYNQSVYVI